MGHFLGFLFPWFPSCCLPGTDRPCLQPRLVLWAPGAPKEEEAPAETGDADNDDLFGGDGEAEGFDDEILDDEIEL